MRQKSLITKDPAERAVRDIRRKTRKQYSAEEKIRIVVSGLRGEESIAALICLHFGNGNSDAKLEIAEALAGFRRR